MLWFDVDGNESNDRPYEDQCSSEASDQQAKYEQYDVPGGTDDVFGADEREQSDYDGDYSARKDC